MSAPARPPAVDPVEAAALAAAAAALAARAVRRGRGGVRVSMPALGSVRHGTAAAALRGCPCLRCERLRAELAATAPADQHDQAVPQTAGSEPAPAAGSGRGRTAYLGPAHPVADPARARCQRVHGRSGALLGTVACGQCWESAIRADERIAAEFDLPAQPPARDRDDVDQVAIERALSGDRVRLNRAELDELADRVAAGQAPSRVGKRIGLSGARIARARAGAGHAASAAGGAR